MKIGITERGDAGLDTSWKDKEEEVDGVILITKNLTKERFRDALAGWKKPLILHCTLTGMAGSILEQNVPYTEDNLRALSGLLRDGLVQKENLVFRIDPIYPYNLSFAAGMLSRLKDYVREEDLLGKCRFRVSVMDFYPHVRERLYKLGVYHERKFTASDEYFQRIRELLERHPEFTFETCAEEKLHGSNIIARGCVSEEDILRMGLTAENTFSTNPQNRHGCLCLSCKTELLTNRKRCDHKCSYCYWK